MSTTNYIPRGDVEFNVWQENLVKLAESNLTDWDIPASDLAALKIIQASWTTSFHKASNKHDRTSADTLEKNQARKVYEKRIRQFAGQWLTHNSHITDSDRAALGLTIRSGKRTPTATPASSPMGKIDFSARLQHTIHFVDETSPTRKAKPKGVRGCEIWMKLDGNAPGDHSELTFLTTSTCTPYVKSFEGDVAGKIVYYRLRWVSSRNQQGPWSSIISAIIAI